MIYVTEQLYLAGEIALVVLAGMVIFATVFGIYVRITTSHLKRETAAIKLAINTLRLWLTPNAIYELTNAAVDHEGLYKLARRIRAALSGTSQPE